MSDLSFLSSSTKSSLHSNAFFNDQRRDLIKELVDTFNSGILGLPLLFILAGGFFIELGSGSGSFCSSFGSKFMIDVLASLAEVDSMDLLSWSFLLSTDFSLRDYVYNINKCKLLIISYW